MIDTASVIALSGQREAAIPGIPCRALCIFSTDSGMRALPDKYAKRGTKWDQMAAGNYRLELLATAFACLRSNFSAFFHNASDPRHYWCRECFRGARGTQDWPGLDSFSGPVKAYVLRPIPRLFPHLSSMSNIDHRSEQ